MKCYNQDCRQGRDCPMRDESEDLSTFETVIFYLFIAMSCAMSVALIAATAGFLYMVWGFK